MNTAIRSTPDSDLRELLTVVHTWRRALGVEGGPTVRQCWLFARELRRAGLVDLQRRPGMLTDFQAVHRLHAPVLVALGPVKADPEAEARRLVRALGAALCPVRRSCRSVEDLRTAWQRNHQLAAAFVAAWYAPEETR